ncbi:MAG: hypothetical protein Q9216_000924 [Gyalolechia sp. 2 TL-2023]
MHHSRVTWRSEFTTPLSLYHLDENVPQSAVRDASYEPQKKRRKIARRPSKDDTDTSEHQDAYLCIAKVDIELIVAARTQVEAISTLSSDAPRPILLQRIERIAGSGSVFLCQIVSERGDLIFDATVSGECSTQSLKVLQRITEIPRLSHKKTASRVFCAITNLASSSRTCERSYLISAKILMPDNQELLEASVSDRRFVHDLCGLDCPTEGNRPWSPRDFYDNVFVPEKKTLWSSFPRIDQLKCQLYPFQQRAIEWLLYRETGRENTKICGQPQLPHGFVKTVDADGKPCFISSFLGTMTSDEDLLQSFSKTRGGILAEEMGLGKTVEMIGLICLHQHEGAFTMEHTAVASPRGCAATLIITPPSILDQWKSELETLAPELRTTTYEGLRSIKTDDNEAYMSLFCNNDIVLTTYNVLAREIHHSGHVPERSFRHEKKYQRRLSPLTQLKWWRVVLDEAQMIESGVSNAAKVAQLIPRYNAWCVSGTPVKKNSQDLRGLLVFLRFPPYCYSAQLWNRLITERCDVFRQIFGTLALRHTKEQIKDDVQLPPQRRVIITVPFTQIEEQNYLTLYNEMCEDCSLDREGNPLSEDWDPHTPSTVERMRSWLLRLRQTCLHAEVGIRNRKALGKGKNPLKTVDEVLDVMTEQNWTALRAEERNLLVTKARRGQILEHAKQSKEALAIWADALGESQIIVSEVRSRLQAECTAVNPIVADTARTNARDAVIATTQIGAPRQRLRSALELEHMLSFFMANAYYQIKSDEQETKPESAEFRELERLEEQYYEKAKLIRKEILVEARGKADSLMSVVHAKSRGRSFTTIPDPKPQVDRGGIESRSVLEKLEDITQVISRQATLISGWREKATKLLLMPLLDEQDTDIQGDEYETSTQQQDTVYSYIDALRAIVSDFHDITTGQRNLLIEHEMQLALRQAIEGGGHSPELLRHLLGIRKGLKPSAGVGSIRGVITDLRELRTSLRAQLERGNVRAGAELGIINKSLTAVQHLSANLSKAGSALQREVELFTDVMNARLEFYRQLQQVSDTVVPYEENADEQSIAAALLRTKQAEGRLCTKIVTLKSTARYLDHIRIDASNNDINRLCIICQQSFEIGVLTSCGHSYCAECLRLWRRHHGTCPTCKKQLDQNDLHQITFKPQRVTVQEETQSKGRMDATTDAGNSPSSIYTDISTSTLNEIKSIDMNVKQSFGTKIDSIARHIIWLREKDPGSKSVVFSQFRDFLWVLGTAFTSFKIGYANTDGKKGVQRFKNDPGVECLLMHAKSSSAGLTLVNATHVFLCEPLINTAIELQAVARVHRIGQHQPTTVWVYVVENTVEKSIYDISVERRLTHVGKPEYRKALNETVQAEEMEGQIEAANTVELEAAPLGKLLSSGINGGEMVNKEDLWSCLFRQKPVHNQAISPTVEQEVGRHLRAAAVDERQDDEEIR